MFTLQTKILFGVIVILLIALLAALTKVWYLDNRLTAAQTELAKESAALKLCNAEHKLFVDNVQKAGEEAIAKAEKQVAKNNKDIKDITNGYLKAKRVADTVPMYISRLRSAEQASRSTSSSDMPTQAEAATGVDDTSEVIVPSTERIIADCREDALKLVWLQAFETRQGESP